MRHKVAGFKLKRDTSARKSLLRNLCTSIIDVERVVKTAHNVAAYLPGETSEYVIIGAHYDHLGLGEQFSMAPSLSVEVVPETQMRLSTLTARE